MGATSPSMSLGSRASAATSKPGLAANRAQKRTVPKNRNFGEALCSSLAPLVLNQSQILSTTGVLRIHRGIKQ